MMASAPPFCWMRGLALLIPLLFVFPAPAFAGGGENIAKDPANPAG